MTANLRANWWLYLALTGFLGYLDPMPTSLRLLNLFFLWPALRALFRLGDRKEAAGEASPEPPLAPVAGGRTLFGFRFAVSLVLLFLWPPALVGQILQYVGDRRAAPRAVGDASAYRQKTRYTLPFSGEWYVFNGGASETTSHSWDLVAQRYAYDFVIADDSLRRWRRGTDGERLEDYMCYGERVLAPADGAIVEVLDGVRDARKPGTGWLDPFASDIRGNCVVIEHAGDEYSVLAHLIPGSVKVGGGEQVARGQEIGRCGNSGNSSEPHLHFHVQDRANFFEAAGLPVTFDDVSVRDGEPEAGRYLVRGTRARQGAQRERLR